MSTRRARQDKIFIFFTQLHHSLNFRVHSNHDPYGKCECLFVCSHTASFLCLSTLFIPEHQCGRKVEKLPEHKYLSSCKVYSCTVNARSFLSSWNFPCSLQATHQCFNGTMNYGSGIWKMSWNMRHGKHMVTELWQGEINMCGVKSQIESIFVKLGLFWKSRYVNMCAVQQEPIHYQWLSIRKYGLKIYTVLIYGPW